VHQSKSRLSPEQIGRRFDMKVRRCKTWNESGNLMSVRENTKLNGHHAPSAKPATPREARHIVVVAVPPVRTLDVYGPVEVFGDANRLHGDPPVYQINVVSAVEDCHVTSHTQLPMLANRTYTNLHGKIDTLLVAGGLGARQRQFEPAFLDWLKAHSQTARRFGAVCTGAFVLAEAGLLNGRRAATHWNWAPQLARDYPQVKVDPDPIYVQDSNCYTSAGVTAGIDLALALVEEDLGSSLALEIAQMLVVFLRRPSGQSQFSATLAAQKTEHRALGDLLAWLPDHLRSNLSIRSLARRTGMSPRNFARVFLQQVGATPARHIEDLRLEAARRQLERGTETLEAVADEVGFQSAEVLRRMFDRRLGVTPGQYRASFGPVRSRS
jgi:transcriptional regulator GlxA family with amidase domain